MAQEIKQANIFGRLGTGIGQGLAEQVPQEIERYRKRTGLQTLANKNELTPFQRYVGIISTPGVTGPEAQAASDLLRQEAIINSNQKQNQSLPPSYFGSSNNVQQQSGNPSSLTTTNTTQATLNPYIPPTGEQQEIMARQLMAQEPIVYRNLDEARQAISSRISADTQRSNAQISARNLEQSVQSKGEQELASSIQKRGANIPGTIMTKLEQKAINKIKDKELTEKQAGETYGQEAHKISREFSNIKALGNLGMITKNPKEINLSIKNMQKYAKENDFQKEAADSLISENGMSPRLAYAEMYPVKEIKDLNENLKSLPILSASKVTGAGGIGAMARTNITAEEKRNKTLEIAPRLARSLGHKGSPLAVGYELEKKGYDPITWKEYLIDNQKELNMTSDQIDELSITQPNTYFGWLNDWFLKSFTGIE